MRIAVTGPLELPDPDSVQVRRMAEGDEAALQELYAKYGRRMFAYALRLTGDQPAAEEVLQDSLLAAWNAAGSFRGEGRVLTWLLGIVHHQALNAIRRKRLPRVGLEKALDTVDYAEGPERLAETADRSSVLAAALSQLSTEHRAVLVLVFYHGLELAEVAEICDCPLGTIKSRLSYAKSHLREALLKAGLHAEDLL